MALIVACTMSLVFLMVPAPIPRAAHREEQYGTCAALPNTTISPWMWFDTKNMQWADRQELAQVEALAWLRVAVQASPRKSRFGDRLGVPGVASLGGAQREVTRGLSERVEAAPGPAGVPVGLPARPHPPNAPRKPEGPDRREGPRRGGAGPPPG